MKIKFTQHAIDRCKKSKVSLACIRKEIKCIKDIVGKLRWMTKHGIIMLEKLSDGVVIVKTFISKKRYGAEKSYSKGCKVY